jgi:hypothetical protein
LNKIMWGFITIFWPIISQHVIWNYGVPMGVPLRQFLSLFSLLNLLFLTIVSQGRVWMSWWGMYPVNPTMWWSRRLRWKLGWTELRHGTIVIKHFFRLS